MIETPIDYNEEDQAVVSAFEALAPEEQDGSFWSDLALNELKSRVKAYYITAQNTRCCYCDRHLGSTNHGVWNTEHVASRASHPRFMFKPTNLAASCPDCNINKGVKEVLTTPNRKTYPKTSSPRTSSAFLIIHPHFDRYEDHIHRINMVYLPKSKKGKKTIFVCDLLRFAQNFIDWENSAADTSFEEEVDTVFDEEPTVSQAAVDAVIAKLPIK